MKKSKKFPVRGREYEVRAEETKDGWELAIFDAQTGKQIPASAALSNEVAKDGEQLGWNLVEEAMVILEEEFKKGTAFEVAIAIRQAERDAKKSK